MIKTTTQQLIDSLGYEGGRVGQPVRVGAALTQDKGTKTLYTVPDGHTLLVTHIVMQADVVSHLGTTVPTPTPAQTFQGIDLLDQSGTNQDSIVFRGFARYASTFLAGGAPEWHNAPVGNFVNWKLKYPIPVSSGWTVRQAENEAAWGNQSAVYGVVVGDDAARSLGASSNPSATVAERRFGIVSTSGATSAADVIPARAGKSIRIMDIQVRMQPETNVNFTLTLQQTDGTKVFVVANDNPAEHLQMAFSPDWFLKAGQALQVVSDTDDAASVNMTYEYVDEDEVPPDVWFSVVEPPAPDTEGGELRGGGALVNNFVGLSTPMTPYYPRAGAAGAASPGKGFQHLLNGYTVTVQKEATAQGVTDDTEQMKMAISTGPTGGQVAIAAGALAQGNYQLSPVISASAHDQCVYGFVDGINLPGKKDDGTLWVDVLGFRQLGASPSEPGADMRYYAVCMWGKTSNMGFSDISNKGT